MLTAKLKMATGVLCGLMILVGGTSQVAGLYDQDNPASAVTAPNAEKIDHLIRQLGSRKFADRAAAAKALAEIGEPALAALRRTAVSGVDLETCRRAEDLVRKIERRWELLCFKGHTDAIPGAVLSPNGQLVLSAGRSESSPRLWDVKTGKELRRFRGHGAAVDGGVAFSRDGKQALSGSADNTVRLWDVTTAKELRCFHGHESGGISSVAFCPDGKRALSASYDMTMRLWQLPK